LAQASILCASIRGRSSHSPCAALLGQRKENKMPPKEGKELSRLNELLTDRSYIAGGSHATVEDMIKFKEIKAIIDKSQFPHLARWYVHIKGLRASRPDGFEWPAAAAAAKKGRAAGKEKKELSVDCQALPVPEAERQVPGTEPLDLGAGATRLTGSAGSKSAKKYYISTAINYSNGWPHMGHAYEALAADVFARYHRLMGEDVFFMTGADEHGQKIATAAEDAGLEPLAICDRYCLGFNALNRRLRISNDFYIRTTMDFHKEQARDLWRRCKANGDIYLDKYEGWYLVREERFVTDQEAQEWDYKDPGSGKPLTKMSEPSFFFRLSKYKDIILKHVKDNKEFIQPTQYRNEILAKLESIEMRDLSISRGTFSWGVPCPEEPVNGKQHVMYVWFDALTNYLSGVHGTDKSHELSHFWPADCHVIGKDIIWFHTVIWPSMLLSGGVPLPKSVAVHGFISGSDGRKMSKSYGNVINAHDMLDKLPADTFRWYLCREAEYGGDLKFSEESLKLMHNSELNDNLGNLVQRAVTMCGGSVVEADMSLMKDKPFDLAQLKKGVAEAMDGHRFMEAANLTITASGATNKWLADIAPWKMKEEERQAERAACLRLLLEAIYVLAHFFAPFIPLAAAAIFKKLSTPARPITDLSDSFANLTTGTEVVTGSILFQQIEVKADVKDKKDGKEKKAKEPEAPPADDNQPLFSKLDIRVGHIVKAWHHPHADRLFVEQIDVGDSTGPRQIVSGLREHYTLEEFEGRKLLVVCNMKPAKLMKVESCGMVLCAKNPEKKIVELLDVPEGCKIGDRVLLEGMPHTFQPAKPDVVKSQKIWESVAEELKTDANKIACFAGKPLTTASGIKFPAPSQASAPIS